MTYSHTQKAPIYLLLYVIGAVMLVGAWLSRDQWPVVLLVSVVGVIMFLLGRMFTHMTVCDEGEALAIRYGPLRGFGCRIHYSHISSVESSRSSIIDGWGIHWIPGRGWTYNLWGRQCAKLCVNGRTVRIGSDDVENLVAFLRSKLK